MQYNKLPVFVLRMSNEKIYTTYNICITSRQSEETYLELDRKIIVVGSFQNVQKKIMQQALSRELCKAKCKYAISKLMNIKAHS